MQKRFVIYCDESIGKGTYFSNFYGGALIRGEDFQQVQYILKAKKESLNLFNELKWSRISAQYEQRYIDFVETFLTLIAKDKIKVRIMFTQNSYVPVDLTSEQIKNSYFLLYYQFIKHAFGLVHSNSGKGLTSLQLNLDQLPDTKEKASTFKNYLLGLNKNPDFKKAKICIRKEMISEIDSSRHVIAQGLDIILGAMAFRLNDMHKVKPAGQRKRGKRTIAKEKIYKFINQKIREIYPGFNIGVTTGTKNQTDYWKHPYRHWNFRASNSEFDSSKTK